ncbi:MAG: hypothetical protein K2X50_08340 [Gammaproteobacteria bacterium]|nr:hypothetical protein [Gammaproteobacteria bacterium]
MSNKGIDEKVIKRMRGETQRLVTAIEKAEGADVRKITLKAQAVERYQEICDESPSKFNSFLKLMGQQSAENLKVLTEMDSYLTNKVSSIITLLRESPNIASEDQALFENLRLLAGLNNKYKEAIFSELNKPENKDKVGIMVSHLLSHDVVTRKEVKKQFTNQEPSVKMALLVDTLMRSKTTGSISISEQVTEIKRLAESDASARGVLFSSLMSLGYATNRKTEGLTGKLMSLILPEDRENALKWSHHELSTVLDHMSHYVAKDDHSKNLYDWALVEVVGEEVSRLSSEAGLGGAHSETSTVDTIDKAGKTKRTGDDIAKEFVHSLVGLGIKPDVHTSRWAAITGNLFEGGNLKFTEVMLDCARELNIIRLNSDRKITDVNWTRALNPFVLLEYAFLALEVGVKRVSVIFGEHTTARAIFQAPFVALIRIPRIVLDVFGSATSTNVVPDRYRAAEKAENKSVENYKGKMQSFEFDKHASTKWALVNFMYAHRKEGAYSNVTTAYDQQISQLLVSRKNNSDASRLAAIEVMALRNTLVEFEGKTIKTSADKLVIESVKSNLEAGLKKLEAEVSKESVREEAKDGSILEGGQTMTDTMRSDSRSEAADESVMSLNLGVAKAEPALDTSSGVSIGSDTEEGVSESSPRTERESLLGVEKAEEPVSLFGRLRQAVAGLFGGGKAEAKTGVEAAGTKVAEYEYNQVRLNGYADKFRGKGDEFNAWLKAQGGQLEIVNEKEFGKFPIEFKGGQRIELSGNGKDVVMKGFSSVGYASFRREVFGKTKPDSISVSATRPSSVKDIASLLESKNKTTFTSVLTSVGLMFQQVGSAIKSFFTGPPTPAAQTVKSEPSVAKADETSRVSVEKSEVARTPKPAPVPTSTASVAVDQKRSSLPPTPVSVEPKNERRQITSAPAKGIPLWVSRVKVTVASNNDLQSTQATVTNYANTHGFRDVQVEQKPHSLSMQLEDNKGGRLSISAQQGKPVVDIEEVKRSDDTPNHIANIATDLPNKGPKDVTVNGRESMKEKVQTALTTVGDHKITTAADKENLSHVANQPSPHK